jgi:hypothetical protein
MEAAAWTLEVARLYTTAETARNVSRGERKVPCSAKGRCF